jgi:4-hydroxybenzoyl-CoA reductase subunit beta
VLRLPAFELAEPATIGAAVELLAEHGERARVIAGGTDLLPNLKHELYDVDVLVSLARVPGLAGVRSGADGALCIGAMTPLEDVARSEAVRRAAPALAQAASLVAGPQHRRMGTLGGNVMLDTRCRWINQTYFWRQALGFCLKKDGSLCHVVEGGQKCVAAASNDGAPALMTLGATLAFEGPDGRRELAIDELWKADGIVNKRTDPREILTEIRVPATGPGHRGAYGKLRLRGSIDFPLFGCAARLELAPNGRVADADLAAVALAARPVRVRGAAEALAGAPASGPDWQAAVERLAAIAAKQLHVLPNVDGDAEWRQAMVPVYVRRTLLAAAAGGGPVHHL